MAHSETKPGKKIESPERRCQHPDPFSTCGANAASNVILPQAFAVVWLLTVCTTGFCQTPPFPQGQLDEVWIHSVSLEGNLLGDSPDKRVLVYLPPSYKAFLTERYPVIYFLHGFSLAPGIQDATADALKHWMDRLIVNNRIQEMIVVIPDGRNSLGGGFYANSPTSGHFEDYIVQDLIAFIDKKYRTVPSSDSRGIGGHSMGGFGAILLAFGHPDIFGAVYAMSPCCLDFGTDSTLVETAWHEVLAMKTREDARQMMAQGRFFGSVYIAMAAAFSPGNVDTPLLSDFPFREDSGKFARNEPAYTEWRSYSGTALATANNKNLLKLKGITMEYGTREADIYIPRGARQLSETLGDLGVPHVLEIFDGDHTSQEEIRMGTVMLPFFSRLLGTPDQVSRMPFTQ